MASADNLTAPDRVHVQLLAFCAGLTDRRPLGVAVSGGSDSLGLLVALSRLVEPRRLMALTVDHGLRAQSVDETRQVKSICRSLGVRHETLAWTSEKPRTGLQAAARAARYQLLGEAARQFGLAAVLTGHTLDDQQETLMMRRARSETGDAAGLAGISPATLFRGHVWVLRPLLCVSRSDIRASLRHAGVDWIEDPSNLDERFERVRMRNRRLRDPSTTVDADAGMIAAERSRLAAEAARYIDANCHIDDDGWVHLPLLTSAGNEVLLTVAEALINLCGGARRQLDRRGKSTLADIAGNRDDGVATLGRALIRRSGAELMIRRERRGIEELVLPSSASGDWDGRYHVRNLDRKSALLVAAAGAQTVAPSFSRDSSHNCRHWRLADGVTGGFLASPLIGRASRVLPVYELPLAQALARLAGADRFPDCPWGDAGKIAMKVQ